MEPRPKPSLLMLACTPLGLWAAALVIGISPIAHSVFAGTARDEVNTLIQLTHEQRLRMAHQFQDRGPLTGMPVLPRNQMDRALDHLQTQTAADLQGPIHASVQQIETRWHELNEAIQKGELSSAQSFAAHTSLLDTLHDLQARLDCADR